MPEITPRSGAVSTPLDQRTLSVVVPVYNGATTLTELVDRLMAVLDHAVGAFEIVLVDDGSIDGSRAVLARLAERNARVRSLVLSRNFGQHNALLCGIRAARHELIVTLDDDLQNPPEDIPRLLNALSDEVDVVYGTPRDRSHDGWRWVVSAVIRLALANVMGATTARWVSPFRLFRTPVREAFASYASSFVSIDVLLSWGTKRFASVPVSHHSRRAGRSNYRVGTLLAVAINMITGFSTLPLQLASIVGFLGVLLGGALFGLVIGRFILHGSPVPGFPFLASIVIVFSGTQLFALGIIGEYLARMHFRTMGRPPYVVRSDLTPVEAERRHG
jgi:glycosyltransferase involved in cell wall biosynthesis